MRRDRGSGVRRERWQAGRGGGGGLERGWGKTKGFCQRRSYGLDALGLDD
jgi:hypothetical protein